MGAFTCNGLCVKRNGFRGFSGMGIRYEDGFKRCIKCHKSIITNEIKCPCCRISLRSHVRYSKDRKKSKENVYRY